MDNLVNNIVAVIPARGGSKRIPRKNIIPIAGKPMIYWTIKAALASQHISKVIVSTDDREIADVAIESGAEVPFLRDRNADDHSSVSVATVRALQQMKDLGMDKPDIVVQLMANCPVRDSDDIDSAVSNFISSNSLFQLSAFKYGWMNPWWAHSADGSGSSKPLFEAQMKMRSQDLPELLCPTGAIWIANVEELIKHETFYGPGYKLFPMHWKKAIDIDDYEDLEMAEYFMKSNIQLVK